MRSKIELKTNRIVELEFGSNKNSADPDIRFKGRI